MICAVLSAAIALSGAQADSAPRNDVAIVLVGARGVRAINPTACDRVLVVGDLEGRLALTLLPAGSDATYPLPAGVAQGSYIELLTLGPMGLERTGAISIDPALSGGAFVVTAAPGHACSFVLGASAAVASTAATSASSSGACTCATHLALLHVPVVVPTESMGPSRPPRLDDEALPVL